MSMGYPFYLIMFLSVLLQAVQMFIARFCDLLEVEVNCDGCSVTLPGRRYRCLQCTDMLFLSVLLQAVQMFIARFCDLLEVEVNCDGCSVTLPGRRYRCLQCTDMLFVSV